MKKRIVHPAYGEIIYEESIWSGKKSLWINGTALKKVNKTTYVLGEGDGALQVAVGGSVMTGVALSIRGEDIWIVSKPTALDWILAAIPFMLMIVWGNNAQLCSIIPVVGGAIGGALGGFGMVYTMIALRERSTAAKLLTALLATLATFAVGALLGFAIVLAYLA